MILAGPGRVRRVGGWSGHRVDLAGEVIHVRLHPGLFEFGQPCLHLAGSRPDAVIGRHANQSTPT